MINRRFAAAACVTGIAALVVPAGMASAGPVASGGVKVAAKSGATGGEHRHEAAIFLAGQFGEIGQVSARSQKQMAVGIGKAIEQDNGQVIAV